MIYPPPSSSSFYTCSGKRIIFLVACLASTVIHGFPFLSMYPSLLLNRQGVSSSHPVVPVQSFSLRSNRSTSSSTSSTSSISISIEEDQWLCTVEDSTAFLQEYDQAQQAFIKQQHVHNIINNNPGIQTLDFCQNHLSLQDRKKLAQAVEILVSKANQIRKEGRPGGRVMLGICAQHVTEGILGLKSFVSSLNLPRGLLHGMDVDGVPIPHQDLGSVYIKYNTGGCRTFTELRDSGVGLEALWQPGDAFLERYEGDFRGVYLNVQLDDGIFRQYGVLPTDLFFPEDNEVW